VDVDATVSPAHDSIRSNPTYARTFRDGKPFSTWGMCGNGGMFSTTTDMYRWSQALLNNHVLSATSRGALFTPEVTVRTDTTTGTSLHYALGWVVETQMINALR
jgi:CubicO group peptidase (beta-lactamase class C family)